MNANKALHRTGIPLRSVVWSGDHGLEPDCLGRARRSILEADSADCAAGGLFHTAGFAGGNARRQPPRLGQADSRACGQVFPKASSGVQ